MFPRERKRENHPNSSTIAQLYIYLHTGTSHSSPIFFIQIGSICLWKRNLDWIADKRCTYKETKAETGDDGGGDGEGGELEVTDVPGKGLADHGHAIERQPRERGRAGDHPQLLGLSPYLLRKFVDPASSPPVLQLGVGDERDIAPTLHASQMAL